MQLGDGATAIADPAIRQKYIEERNKRLRPEGLGQFLKLADSTQFKYLEDDPWVDHAALNAKIPVLPDGDDLKFLVLGAGYGGLLFAVHLIEAGFNAADIRIVDVAGGFGGTWYWNRYPGLMCDTESYIFMPLVEETGYMPRFKYAYGPELREHANRIAENAHWDGAAKRWIVQLVENRGPTEPKKEIKITAQYVLVASGVLDAPHIPRLPGFDQFKGQHFHTSRWNYDITGGTDTDWTLDKLKDKRVGILGTGATAVQAVPHLAKWAKHLYVFQRTPSSVDPNGDDLVNDGWCHLRSFFGRRGIIAPEQIPEHVAMMHAYDIERAEKIRARTTEVVRDREIADKLKHWYPSWCKRPTFHDDYLPVFNQPNVTLVDTDGKGVEGLTADAVAANGTSYPIDVLVLSTGFALSVKGGSGSPAQRSGMKVFGRDGLDMDDKWVREGTGTLHGVASRGFPNFFFYGAGLAHVGLGANFTYTLDLLASHVATTLAEAERRAGGDTSRVTVEPTKAAEDEWVGEIVKRASWFAAMPGCTLGWINNEGATPADAEEKTKATRNVVWGEGVVSFTEVLRAWQDEGELRGLQIDSNM
ncbi:flavin-binding monooxygenase-like family protein [Mycena olivaceomarginata]|nr:flavin-binding monooxygenase-like family protein [Mycena olivaceomarginata]